MAEAVPMPGTVRRVARPRGVIPKAQEDELVAARDQRAAALLAADAAESRFKRAVQAAIKAGGSYSVVAETADVARSTVQRYVDSM